jgi:hypothetical protein
MGFKSVRCVFGPRCPPSPLVDLGGAAALPRHCDQKIRRGYARFRHRHGLAGRVIVLAQSLHAPTATEYREDYDEDEDKPQDAAGPITPVSAVRPCWECADQQKQQEDDQNGLDWHGDLRDEITHDITASSPTGLKESGAVYARPTDAQLDKPTASPSPWLTIR